MHHSAAGFRASRLGVSVVLVAGFISVRAVAQEPSPPPGSVVVPSDSGDIVVTPGQTTTSQVYVPPPGFPQPGTDINAGLPSSSRPTTGGGGDGFDLNVGGGGAGVLRGNKGSAGLLTRADSPTRPVLPGIHVVHKGDTLWDICAQYFGDPWSWPKLWARNPQVQNPHWIYPGDQLRLAAAGGAAGPSGQAHRLAPGETKTLGVPGGNGAASGLQVGSVAPKTVFFRNQSYIGDPDRDVWGEVVGAREEQMLLSEGNYVYLQMNEEAEPEAGQVLSIFREVRSPERVRGARRPEGVIVAIQGSVRLDHWDPETRIARGRITESLDVIERGAKVGQAERSVEVVPPKPSGVTLWARVLTSVYPHEMVAQNQVVFIDKGSEDGLAPGNRLFVVRKGDSWRRSLETAASSARERLLMDSTERVSSETTPLRGDQEDFPAEVVAQLQVLRTEKTSSLVLVVESSREIVAGDRALAREGR